MAGAATLKVCKQCGFDTPDDDVAVKLSDERFCYCVRCAAHDADADIHVSKRLTREIEACLREMPK